MPFSKEEVFYVLLKLNEAKAPRPDGYFIAFW